MSAHRLRAFSAKSRTNRSPKTCAASKRSPNEGSTLRVAIGWNPSRVFDDPLTVWAPESIAGARAALHGAEQALREGYWIAGALSYELGAQTAGFDASFETPLLVLGAFKPPRIRYWHGRSTRFDLTAPLARVSFETYAQAIERIRGRIADGEVYQVNYTVPFDLRFAGDPFALYRFLARRAKARYAAYVQHDDLALVSLSPELFLS